MPEKEKTQNVKFTQTYEVQDGSGVKFEKDKVYELPEASARHYVNRKVAEFVDEEPAQAPKPIRDESKKDSAKESPKETPAETKEAPKNASKPGGK